jgi:glycerol-3-phosphate acyltransferase PlsX
LCLVGDADSLRQQAAEQGADVSRLSFEHAPENIPMNTSPSALLRQKDNSSMRAALGLLARGEVEGVVSAGNTGALMALGRKQVNMLPGFSRPAFCSALPGSARPHYLLDLGANVDCSSAQLCEFALMGAGLVRALHQCQLPSVALLSNGAETGKGTDAVREAAAILEQDKQIDFRGFIEADQLLETSTQVIVCDGFTGNIALKAMEGTARYVFGRFRDVYNSDLGGRALGWLSRRRMQNVAREINPENHAGAFLLGLKGVVVKSHGDSTIESFAAALEQAAVCIEHDMVSRMARSLETQP